MSNSPPPSTRAAQHEMRARVPEAAVSVEYVIDEVLSVTYAKNEALASELQLEVIALLGIEAKLRLLEDVFTAYDLQLVAPALIQTIRDLFALRHLLAHGQVHPPERDGVLRVTTYRRGKVNVVERPLGDVVDLARRSFEAGTALRRTGYGFFQTGRSGTSTRRAPSSSPLHDNRRPPAVPKNWHLRRRGLDRCRLCPTMGFVSFAQRTGRRKGGSLGPLAPLHDRLHLAGASQPLVDEMWDWRLLDGVMPTDETRWMRVPARGVANAAARGFIFLTDAALYVVVGRSGWEVHGRVGTSRVEPLRIPLGYLRSVEANEGGRRHVHVSLFVSAPGDLYEYVASVSARDYELLSVTLGTAIQVASRARRNAVPLWGFCDAAARFIPGSDWTYSGAGTLSLTVAGTMIFTPPPDAAQELLLRGDDAGVWMNVVDVTPEWGLKELTCGRPTIAIMDSTSGAKVYAQPEASDGSFEQWVGRLRDMGVRQHPPGWPA